MKTILEDLFYGGRLSRAEAASIIAEIARGEHSAAHIAAFLTAFRMRSLSLDELSGFRDGVFSLATRVDLSAHDAIDVCGTGGDGKNSLNVSTAVAFVVAGAGVKVAKHGNHGVSSVCGSSTVLEHLGITFTSDASTLNRQLENAGICFLHAPLFHSALKSVASIRKELGFKTLFNNLGPLLNPAGVATQLLGVYNLELARLYKYYFQSRDGNVAIVHSVDGFDEVSLCSETHVFGVTKDYVVDAVNFGFDAINEAQIASSGAIADNARALVELLEGAGSPAYRSVVLANSALAIQLKKPKLSLLDAVALGKESLDSGSAKRSFESLRSIA